MFTFYEYINIHTTIIVHLYTIFNQNVEHYYFFIPMINTTAQLKTATQKIGLLGIMCFLYCFPMQCKL